MRKLKIAIPFTPHTPRPIYFVAGVLVAITMFCTISHAQPKPQHLVLDSLSNYEFSYQKFLQQKWKAERAEFVVTNRKKWWYYLPSVGFAFGGPTVSANTGVLAQIDRDRNVMASKLLSLDKRYQVEFVETLVRIRVDYQKLLVRYEQLERERKTLAKLRGIQAIHDEAFGCQTMSPEEHPRNSYQYETTINTFQDREAELRVALLEFQTLCRHNLPDKQLIPVETFDCIMEDEEAMRSIQPGVTIQAYPTKRPE